MPPRRLHAVGHSDFAAGGDEFLAHFVELGGLQPFERVLDVACGIGQMARPLAGYLSDDGSYDGFDADRQAVAWCRRRYRRHANFRFQVGDDPLPYEDASFDFVIAVGLFTRLLEGAAMQRLAECGRVLAPGGRLVATFFLLTDTSRALIGEGKAGLPFLDPDERVAILDESVPEEAVAYDDEWLLEALHHSRLDLSAIHPGSWAGREAFTSFADIVVAHA